VAFTTVNTAKDIIDSSPARAPCPSPAPCHDAGDSAASPRCDRRRMLMRQLSHVNREPAAMRINCRGELAARSGSPSVLPGLSRERSKGFEVERSRSESEFPPLRRA
jgi:hypothetical protein